MSFDKVLDLTDGWRASLQKISHSWMECTYIVDINFFIDYIIFRYTPSSCEIEDFIKTHYRSRHAVWGGEGVYSICAWP